MLWLTVSPFPHSPFQSQHQLSVKKSYDTTSTHVERFSWFVRVGNFINFTSLFSFSSNRVNQGGRGGNLLLPPLFYLAPLYPILHHFSNSCKLAAGDGFWLFIPLFPYFDICLCSFGFMFAGGLFTYFFPSLHLRFPVFKKFKLIKVPAGRDNIGRHILLIFFLTTSSQPGRDWAIKMPCEWPLSKRQTGSKYLFKYISMSAWTNTVVLNSRHVNTVV